MALFAIGGVGSASDFKIYDEEAFEAGLLETHAQNVDMFNASSLGAITLVMEEKKGDFEKQAFLQKLNGLISRRDNTDTTTSLTSIAMTQDENISVKLNRTIGPVDQTIDSWKKIGEDPERMSFYLGQMVAADKERNFADACVRAVEAALDAQTDVEHDATDGTLATTDLITGISKAGDQFGEIVIWMMHSKPYFNLLANQVTNAIYRANGTRIMSGVPVTLDRPVVVTDSPALIEAGSPTTYITLGLKVGAVSAVESEPVTIVEDWVTGLASLAKRIQGEMAFNVGVKGFKWGSTANPADAALGNGANWTKTAASHKQLAGIAIKSQ